MYVSTGIGYTLSLAVCMSQSTDCLPIIVLSNFSCCVVLCYVVWCHVLLCYVMSNVLPILCSVVSQVFFLVHTLVRLYTPLC